MRTTGALVLALLLVQAAGARAERVALHGLGAELQRATALALASWRAEVIAVAGENPGATMPEAVRRAEALAQASGARAVVWLTNGSASPSLWVYDVASRRAMTLQIGAALPFDEPTAAAVALTIKTLLRYGEVAPVEERMALPAPPAKRFALEARGSALARPDPAARWEARVAVTALVRVLPAGRLLVGLGVGAGPGLDVVKDDFDGRYQDTQIFLCARYEVDLGHRVSLAPTAGVTLHVASLGGTSASRGRSAEAGFADPGIDVGLRLGAQLLPRLQVALVAEGSTLLRRQRYLDGSRELFDMPLVAGEIGLAILVPLF